MTASVPFRDTFWNVPGWAQIGLYVGGLIAVAIFAYGMWQRVMLWRRGLPEYRHDRILERVGRVLTHALGQVRTLSQAYPGVMHAIMFWASWPSSWARCWPRSTGTSPCRSSATSS